MKALQVVQNGAPLEALRIVEIDAPAPGPGQVRIKVAAASLNFNDIDRCYGRRISMPLTPPFTLGMDVCGVVDAAGAGAEAWLGKRVVALTNFATGGLAEYARLAADDTIVLPAGLSLRESMMLGTAGFTAALALLRMQDNGQTPVLGPVAVTGASGGVGALAINLFSGAGYAVHAISGKREHFDWLRQLGASECIDRHQLGFSGKALDSARFGGALDAVGGAMLSGLLPLIAPTGNVALCGNAGGATFSSTVMPFIIRAVSLLGIGSALTSRPVRERIWQHLAGDWKPRDLARITRREVTLDQLPGEFARMLEGQSLGRTLVRIGSD